MKIYSPFRSAIIIAALIFAAGCEKTPEKPSQDSEKEDNLFIYDGYSFDINSVVQYDTGTNQLEFWLSSQKGLQTTQEVTAAGDYVVISTHKSYLGTRDRFTGTASDNSSIRFCNEVFSKGDEGNGYIRIDMKDDILTLEFVAQYLYTKANAEPKNKIEGKYEGTFVIEPETEYTNQWGPGRERNEISDVLVTFYEDNTKTCIDLYSDNGEEFNLQIIPDYFGRKIFFPGNSTQGLALTYGGDKTFNMNGIAGFIETKISDESFELALDIQLDDNRMRAYYKGEYRQETVKTNRYIYLTNTFDGADNQYVPLTEKYEIKKLLVSESDGTITFYFATDTDYAIGNSDSVKIPKLSVPASIVNAGRHYFNTLEEWEVIYDKLYISDDEPLELTDDNWVEISRTGDYFEISGEISYQSTTSPLTGLDFNFKGNASR